MNSENRCSIRVMSSNIWGDYFNNPVSLREDALLAVYRRYAPDLLGMQEATASWYGARLLPELSARYTIIGSEVCVGQPVNFTPLLYRTDRFEALETGWERLPDTDDLSKTVTYAVLREKATGVVFAACNTHFWWMAGPEHDVVRVANSDALIARMKALQNAHGGCPAIAFGDFNCTIDSEAFRRFAQNGISDLQKEAKTASQISSHHGDPVLGADGLYHGAQTTNDFTQSIDHIVACGRFTAETYEIITDDDALSATDHSPIYADLTLFGDPAN